MKSLGGLLAVVCLVSACSSTSSEPKQGAAGQSASATIGPQGGSVAIDGVGTVTFPPGALPSPTLVKLETTADPATAAVYDETSVMFKLGKRAPYELRINTGSVQPTAPLQLVLTVPPSFGLLGTALGQVLEASEMDTFDQFELLEASDDGLGTGQLKVSMPGTWVSNGRRSDGAFEGIVTLAQTFALPDGYPIPGQQSVEPGQTHIQGGESGGCPVKKFAPPVKPPVVTSPFSSTRSVVVSGKTYVGHWGVDLRASSGTTLYSVGKGKVLVSYTSTSFGESVVLDIEGVGAVRYAHMKSRSVQKGATVTCGQVIGEADNTGLTQAPHLHFELTPNGNYNTNSAKIDPFPCIDVNACVGCPLDVEYSGATKYTLHQVYDSTKNTGDEDILVTASSVTLSPDPQAEGYLRPTAGAISYTRTMKQYVSPTLTCAISTTGSGQVVAGDPMAGALTCLPPPQPDGSDFFYTTTLPMATKFTLTTTNSCGQGSTEEGGAGWLLIPSMYSGKGYTATRDAKVLSGTYSQPTGPGGGATETWEWNFTRVEK